jgi:hypothetical protein
MWTGHWHGLLRLDLRLAETEKNTRRDSSGSADPSSTMDEYSAAGLELRRDLWGKRPERLAIVGNAEVRNWERLHHARDCRRVEGCGIGRRLGAHLVGRGKAHDGLDAVDSKLRPSLFQGFTPTGHAVKPEAAGNVAW